MKITNDILTPDMIKRPEEMPKTRLVKYTIKCPLCDAKNEVVAEVPRYSDFMALTSEVCDECKSVWTMLKKKCTEVTNE